MEDNILNITISAEYSANLANQIANDRDEYDSSIPKETYRNRLWKIVKTTCGIFVGLATVISALLSIISFLSN